MRRIMVAGLALGLASAGVVVVAGPGAAQEADSEMTLTPEVAAPGDAMTAASVDPCTPAGGQYVFNWSVTPSGSDEVIDGDELMLDENVWEVTFEAPSEEGDYEFHAVCDYYTVPLDDGNGDEEPNIRRYEASFSVDARGSDGDGDGNGGGSDDTAEPAQPITDAPNFTG